METLWTVVADLETRIDAEYYQSAFVEADGRLREGVATETLQKLWATYNRIYIGIAGFEAVSETSHYTPYLRPADIGLSGEIDYVNLPWCKRHWLEDHGKKGCARPGDLLIEVKGNTRKVAVVNERIPDRCIVSGSAYRLVLRSGVDPHFVMAYFLSPTGQLLKRRLTSNTTISYIDPESFRSLRVPLPPQEVQRAIGNKVRKAERLRELSRLAYAAVDAKIHELYGRLPKGESSELSVWVRPIQLGESRLDAWFHRPLYLRMAHDLQLRKDVVLVAQLANRVTETFRPEEWNSDTFEYFEIGGVDSATSVATPTVVPVVEASSRAKTLVRESDVLVSTVRPNLRAIAQVGTIADGIGVASSGFCALRTKTREVGAYLRACLVSSWGTHQLMRWNAGGTYPAIENDVPLGACVPNPGQQVMEQLGEEILLAAERTTDSGPLIEGAKLAVEQLIEGALDVSTLVSEGEAIERWLTKNPSSSREAN